MPGLRLYAMKLEVDLVIVGSGFGGSILALIAQRLGRRVALIEKGQHPRFAIGESTTPLANLLLEELGERYDLPCLRSLSRWGTWQAEHPEIAGGLKRGFSFYHHSAGVPFDDSAMHSRQLLVAASPNNAVADTHWYRPAVDHFLIEQACAMGATLIDRADAAVPDFFGNGVTLCGTREGEEWSVRAGFMVDATGPRGYLHRALHLEENKFPGLPNTVALFNHFTGVTPWSEVDPTPGLPPFPPDEAALHHVFDGGWIWVLRFNNGVMSAGVVLQRSLARKLGVAAADPVAWQRVLKRFPSVAAAFVEASPVGPFRYQEPVAFRSGRAVGQGWALLPSAAGFIDPLLSTGFPLTLMGIARIGKILEQKGGLREERFEHSWRQYEERTFEELDRAARLIAALQHNLHDFELFRSLMELYFVAAVFSEVSRRLGHQDGRETFLLGGWPPFAIPCEELLSKATGPLTGEARTKWLKRTAQLIFAFDAAGLSDAERRHWHGVVLEDLYKAQAKLGATLEQLDAMLRRCGLLSEA